MNLRHKRSKTRVLLLSESTFAYGRSVGNGISVFAVENDWELAFEPRGASAMLPSWVHDWRGDGIIAQTDHPQLLRPFRKLGIPIVELMGNARRHRTDITVDEQVVGTMAANYLFSKGFRHFGFYAFGQSWWSAEREKHFVDAIEQHGFSCMRIPPISGSRYDAMPSWTQPEEKRLTDWLLKLPRPIGVFAANDLHAHRLLLACQKLNIAVPESIAILGSGNDPWFCQFQSVPLSSIQTDGFSAGYQAAALLKRLLQGQSRPKGPLRIPPKHIVTRRSTDIIAVEDEDVIQSLRFIRENACSKISILDIVNHIHLSQKNLERKFHRFLKRTPLQEIKRVRIEQAKILLRETNLSLASIAQKVGIETPEYLIRIFKQACGQTPNQYRLTQRRELSVN